MLVLPAVKRTVVDEKDMAVGEARQYKRMNGAPIPREIQALPHVMNRIDELLMSQEEAAMRAAETGQAMWLKTLLSQIYFDMENVARRLVEIGAAHGHCNVIYVAYEWWARPDDYKHEQSCHAMQYAIYGGHLEAVDFLLHLYNWDLKQALGQALKTGRPDMVEVLCKEASFDEFQWAAEEGHLQVIELLHDQLPDFLHEAVETAAYYGHLGIVKFLHERYGRGLYDAEEELTEEHDIPIESAARNGHLDVVKFLFDNEGFVNRTELDDAFVSAAGKGSLEITRFLFDHGVNQPTLLDCAYPYAASGGQLEVMQFLYNNGGGHKPSLLENAFVRAATGDHVNVVKFLLEHGADRSLLDDVFIKAAAGGQAKIVRFLYNHEGRRHPALLEDAFTKAATGGHLEIVKFLFHNGLSKTALFDDAFLQASAGGHLGVVTFLHELGEYRASVLDEAFARAIIGGHLNIVKFLYKIGVKQATLFDDALVQAATKGHPEMVKFLCHNGGRRRHESFMEAFTIAKTGQSPGHRQLVNILGRVRRIQGYKLPRKKTKKKQKHCRRAQASFTPADV